MCQINLTFKLKFHFTFYYDYIKTSLTPFYEQIQRTFSLLTENLTNIINDIYKPRDRNRCDSTLPRRYVGGSKIQTALKIATW